MVDGKINNSTLRLKTKTQPKAQPGYESGSFKGSSNGG